MGAALIRVLIVILVAALHPFPQPAFGKEEQYQEPTAILEIGPAAEWGFKNGEFSKGAMIAVESTIIEDWLEIELGSDPLFARGRTELGVDLLFKKPYTLSKTAEVMIGLGPEWVHSWEKESTSSTVGIEAVLDFMFWPARTRRFGWYLEPSYGYNFGPGHEQSFGISIGLLIGIP